MMATMICQNIFLLLATISSYMLLPRVVELYQLYQSRAFQ